MFIKTNPNPKGAYVGDCVVRALAIALNRSWEDVYLDLCTHGLFLCDMPSSNKVWADYLSSQGFKRYIIPNECIECYTIRDFAGEYFKGTYIVGTGTHAVCVRNGNILDAWDSSDETPLYYWKKEE